MIDLSIVDNIADTRIIRYMTIGSDLLSVCREKYDQNCAVRSGGKELCWKQKLLRLFHAGIRKTYYPLEERKLQLLDALHQKIWDVSVHTLKCCIHEHYEDCPWREQAMYAYDSRIQMLCGYYAFGELEMPRASLKLMALSLREDGLLELVSPGRVGVDIPGFTVVFVRQVWEYLKFSKDTELMYELFETIETIVKGFADRIQENGLLKTYEDYWNFYEWRTGLQGGPGGRYDCPLNALVSDALYCFARICE